MKGDRSENIEQSINCCEKALEAITRNDLPMDWAMIQQSLAVAYLYRIRGNRAENLEKSINLAEKTLEVYTKNDLPINWATTQNNLANAYFERIRGDRSENLEKSIYYYQKALEIRTKRELSIDWAMTQNNLAMAYSERIRGDRSENLEKSIYYYQKALEIRTKKESPIDWAMTKSNLASTCAHRIRGDRSDNLEKSIHYYQKALEIITKKEFPIYWAMIRNNLAIAYLNRIQGERADNLEKSIYYCLNALEIRTKNDFPIDWAITQNNLAIAYLNRIHGNRTENLEKSIEYYENVLLIIADSGFLHQLENIRDDLADAYLQRVTLGKIDILNLNSNRIDQTNKTLEQLTQNCLEQADWYKATLSLSLWSKALISQKAVAQAAELLLQAISLDVQHNPHLVDTDLKELARLMTQLDWQPERLSAQWQVAMSTLPFPVSPLTSELQAQICLIIGITSIQEKYWYKGLDWLKACWKIQQTLDDLEGLAEVSYQLAIGHHIASNLSYAGIYYRDAQRIFQHLNDIRKVAFCHHGLGRLLLQLGKIELAISEFDQALSIYQTIPNSPQVADRIGDINYYKRIITKMQDPTLTNQVI
jgi:tetratricopeptide (TPR) repeat protein